MKVDERSNGLIEQAVKAAFPPEGECTPEKAERVMAVIAGMPVPARDAGEKSIFFRACYTLYTGCVAGVMAAFSYIFFFSGLFDFRHMLLFPDARSALFGFAGVITGCFFILLKAREANMWLAVRLMSRGAVSRPVRDTAVILLLAGAGFCVYGGVIFFWSMM